MKPFSKSVWMTPAACGALAPRGTVQARLDKLAATGVITGWGPDLSPEALGFPVTAFLTLEIRQGSGGSVGHEAVAAHLSTIPEVLEAYTITGSDGADTFTTHDGDDVLSGYGGNDVFDGGAVVHPFQVFDGVLAARPNDANALRALASYLREAGRPERAARAAALMPRCRRTSRMRRPTISRRREGVPLIGAGVIAQGSFARVYQDPRRSAGGTHLVQRPLHWRTR